MVAMPRSIQNIPKTDSEFGGGPGLIDSIRRSDRVIGQDATASGYQNAGEELWELYATNPNDSLADPATSDLNYQPRPEPTPWPDPSTAEGTTR